MTPSEDSSLPAGAPGRDPDYPLISNDHPGDTEREDRATEVENGAAEMAGDVIGNYRLLGVLGEGGFGRVWLAEQSRPVRRQVAMKIIKPGMDTFEVISRFRREQESLARMEHPGIARVFDAGATPTGRPYFTMEVVRGLPLSDFCDQKALGIPERLALFAKVCQAVQHAHQKGVIHRDLKPSNILVTEESGEAVPRIIDFGVAKALGRAGNAQTFATRLNQVVGTPGYMSPEQMDSSGEDIDTRSDIFSLGVILYELLTGTLPAGDESRARRAMEAAWRAAMETTPAMPSRRVTTLDVAEEVARRRGVAPDRLRAMLRGDLDWITLKCLEPDRRRRYDTVGSLATDIRNTMENRPVSARPPSLSYVLGRSIRRNRLAFGLGFAALAALVAGIFFSTWFFLREREARIQSELMRREAEVARDAATRARGSAEEFITWLLSDLNGKLRPLGRLDLLDDIASTVSRYYEKLPEGERNAASEFKRARVLLLLGDVDFQRNQLPQALRCYHEGMGILAVLGSRDPGNKDVRFLNSVLASRVGDAMTCHGTREEVVKSREIELELTRAVVADNPTDQNRLAGLCITLRKVAEAYYRLKRFAEAHQIMEECLRLTREHHPEHLPYALHIKADWLRDEKKFEKAVALYRVAEAEYVRIFADTPDDVKQLRYLVVARSSMVSSLLALDRLEEAREKLAVVITDTERLAKIDPSNTDVQRDRGTYLRVRGCLRVKEGRLDEAFQDWHAALDVFAALCRKDPLAVNWQRGLMGIFGHAKDVQHLSGQMPSVWRLQAEVKLVLAEVKAAAKAMDDAATHLKQGKSLVDAALAENPDDPVFLALRERARLLEETMKP